MRWIVRIAIVLAAVAVAAFVALSLRGSSPSVPGVPWGAPAEPPGPSVHDPVNEVEEAIVRGVSHLERDAAGTRRLWTGADTAREVAARENPGVFGRLREVEAEGLRIKIYGTAGPDVGRRAAAALTTGTAPDRIVGLVGRPFEVALYGEGGTLICSVRSDTGSWSGWGEPTGARLAMEGNVRVTSMIGVLETDKLAFDVSDARIATPGSYRLEIRGKERAGSGFDGACSLAR